MGPVTHRHLLYLRRYLLVRVKAALVLAALKGKASEFAEIKVIGTFIDMPLVSSKGFMAVYNLVLITLGPKRSVLELPRHLILRLFGSLE